jgi:transcriptional regulator with PAS, ATPase and Fis domain
MKAQADEIGRLQRRLWQKSDPPPRARRYPSIVGDSVGMRRVFALLDRVVNSDTSVLITGESGTGKELVARALHDESARRGGPFVAVNCGAMPEALLESELFGHVKGAFTGAASNREGLFVAAQGGTLFLDELGEMSLAMQVKLLRALQEREIRPVGQTRAVTVRDVRVVAATNRRLRQEVAGQRFREDLYYRIAVLEVELPPLRERAEDIPDLVAAILAKKARQRGRQPWRMSRDALALLLSQPWPGNVRQLENAIVRATLMTDADVIGARDVELPPVGTDRALGASRADYRAMEAERIRHTLSLHRWNISAAARALAMPRSTLYRKLKQYQLGRSA